MIRTIVRLNEASEGGAECILVSQEGNPADAVIDALVRITDQIAESRSGGPLSLADPIERRIDDVCLAHPKADGKWGVAAKVTIGREEVEIIGTVEPYSRKEPPAC